MQLHRDLKKISLKLSVSWEDNEDIGFFRQDVLGYLWDYSQYDLPALN